jgi:hypothetical protein
MVNGGTHSSSPPYETSLSDKPALQGLVALEGLPVLHHFALTRCNGAPAHFQKISKLEKTIFLLGP